MSCRMVRTQTAERCQQRTLQKQESDTRTQIPQTDTDRNRMGRITNPKLFLLKFQLHPDHGQEKEQDENTGGDSPQDTRRRLAHDLQRRGLHRHLPQKNSGAEENGGTDQKT